MAHTLSSVHVMELRVTLDPAAAPDGPGHCTFRGLGNSIPVSKLLVGTRSPLPQDVPGLQRPGGYVEARLSPAAVGWHIALHVRGWWLLVTAHWRSDVAFSLMSPLSHLAL